MKVQKKKSNHEQLFSQETSSYSSLGIIFSVIIFDNILDEFNGDDSVMNLNNGIS